MFRLRTVLRQKQKYTGYEFDQRDVKAGWTPFLVTAGMFAVTGAFSYYMTIYIPRSHIESEKKSEAEENAAVGPAQKDKW